MAHEAQWNTFFTLSTVLERENRYGLLVRTSDSHSGGQGFFFLQWHAQPPQRHPNWRTAQPEQCWDMHFRLEATSEKSTPPNRQCFPTRLRQHLLQRCTRVLVTHLRESHIPEKCWLPSNAQILPSKYFHSSPSWPRKATGTAVTTTRAWLQQESAGTRNASTFSDTQTVPDVLTKSPRRTRHSTMISSIVPARHLFARSQQHR